jgi:isopropylmalate/homocitrate/citramalate synthase
MASSRPPWSSGARRRSRFAKKLDAMGIHRIEAGMPAVSEQDKAAISDIAALGTQG